MRKQSLAHKVASIVFSVLLTLAFIPIPSMSQAYAADVNDADGGAPVYTLMADDTTVTIGTGTEKNKANPPYGDTWYNSSLNEFIFTPAEISTQPVAIRAIAFDATAVAALNDETVSVYMGTTSATSFADEYDIITEDLEKVYSGTMNLGTAADWEPIVFDDEYAYDGVGNLVVLVMRTGSRDNRNLIYNCTATADNSNGSLVYYQDFRTQYADPEAMLAATSPSLKKYVEKVRPNVQLTIGQPSSPMYGIAVPEGIVGGTVTTSKAFSPEGKTITVTATPDIEHTLGGITVTDSNGGNVAVTDGTFVMPGDNVTVSATFIEKPDLAITIADCENGSLSAQATAKEGTTVNVTAIPSEGYELATLTITPQTGDPITTEDTSFTMPNSPVTLSAAFLEKVNLSPAVRDGSPFSLESEHSIKWALEDDQATGRSYIATNENGASASITITTDQHGWLIFDWGFTTSDGYGDKFVVSASGDTTYNAYILPTDGSLVDMWATRVIDINAGTTTITWSYDKGEGSKPHLDDVHFTSTQTPINVSAGANISAVATAGDSQVEAVDPGTKVTFAATPENGYVFAGWTTGENSTEIINPSISFSEYVYADEPRYHATAKVPFENGSGTEEDPYQITSMDDLVALQGYVASGNTFEGVYLKVMNDLADDGTSGFDTIGTSATNSFRGIFDGGNHTISGITSSKGLFGYVGGNAVIRDLTVDATVTATNSYVGIVVGSMAGGTISNVTAKGSVTSSKTYVGGIVGNLNSGIIEDCTSEATVSTTADSTYGANVGGITGYMGNGSSVKACKVTASVSGGANGGGVGGIAGFVYPTCTLENCLVQADVSGFYYVGGIVGNNQGACVVTNCLYEGNVTGNRGVGGIVGYQQGSSSANGVKGCVSTGTVTGAGGTGGIAGYVTLRCELSGNIALQSSIQGSDGWTGRILGFYESNNFGYTPTLSGNAAWQDMTVLTYYGDPAELDDEDFGADQKHGGPVASYQLLGSTMADAVAALPTGDAAWTTEAGKMPYLTTFGAQRYPKYIAIPGKLPLAEAVIGALAELLEAPQTSADGSDIPDGEEWVTPEALQAVRDAVVAARAVLDDPDATQDQINDVAYDLGGARDALAASKTTAHVDRSGLSSAISAAKAAESGVATSTDGSNAGDQQWTTAAEKSALDKAISSAQAIAGDAKATQAQVDEQQAALVEATSTYNANKKLWHRIWGKTAPDTMKNVAAKFGNAKVAIVTTDANYKDALAASALAGKNSAIVLMTKKGSLTAQTKAALKSAGVKKVYLVGSTSDVSASVEKALKSGTGVTKVIRISGGSASAKAIAAAKMGGKRSDTVIIATQNGFQDALSIAPYSYATKSPILYAETNKKLSSATVGYIKSAGYKQAIIVGGPIALPASIDSQLKSAGVKQVTRLAGANSYATSQLIANWSTGQLKNGNHGTYKGKPLAYVKFQPSVKMNADRLAVSTGQNWLDALAGAALCGKNKSVLLLADAKTAKSNYTLAPQFCKANKSKITTAAYVFGGTSAVQAKVWDALVASTK